MGIEIVEHVTDTGERYFSGRKISSMEEYLGFVYRRIGGLLPNVSNCLGTALFCVGETTDDDFLWGYEADKKIDTLEQTKKIKKGMLVAWERGVHAPHERYYRHAGIVMNTSPLLITNIYSADGPIIHNQPLEKINNTYCASDVDVKYFIPRMMESIL